MTRICQICEQPSRGPITVGVDIGTTSVKALAVDENGEVVARSRVAHSVLAPSRTSLRHDARRAWRAGPQRPTPNCPPAGRRRGTATSPGWPWPPWSLAHRRQRRGRADAARSALRRPRGRPAPAPGRRATPPIPAPGMPDAEGFLRWAHALAPEAKGYWPCQAVATHASPACRPSTPVSPRRWAPCMPGAVERRDARRHGGARAQLPDVVPMCEAGGTLPGSDTVFTGGSIDAMCDQVVAGADQPGDVHVIFGATLIVWVVADEWLQVPGLISYPHTTPDRFVIGGPSNAGALFVDWARTCCAGPPSRARPREAGPRLGVARSGAGLVALRARRAHAVRRPHAALEPLRARHRLGRRGARAGRLRGQRVRHPPHHRPAGVTPRRIVASGGGSRVTAWMAAVADATDLPVDALTVPDGAARGGAFFARMAAGLETSLNDSSRWASVGRRIEPDPGLGAAAADVALPALLRAGDGRVAVRASGRWG
jgi:xylulokinase